MALRGVGHDMSGVFGRVTFLVLGSPLKAQVSCSLEKQHLHFVDKGHNTHARTARSWGVWAYMCLRWDGPDEMDDMWMTLNIATIFSLCLWTRNHNRTHC